MRAAAVEVVGTLHLFLGDSIKAKFPGEKSDLIEARCQQNQGQSAPAPIFRRESAGAAGTQESSDMEGSAEDAQAPEAMEASTSSQAPARAATRKPKPAEVERTDLSQAVPSQLVEEMADKSWKIRSAALEQLGQILKKHSHVQPELGSLGQVLVARLEDSNKNLMIAALNHFTALAPMMGLPAEQRFVESFLPAILAALTDSKDAVRVAAVEALTAWAAELDVERMLPVRCSRSLGFVCSCGTPVRAARQLRHN